MNEGFSEHAGQKVNFLSDSQGSLLWLVGIAICTVVLWYVPYGYYVLYPFTILSTWFHEMGHGLTAILMGGSFKKLEIFSDGSGLATHSSDLFLGPLGSAIVAAGGLLGPAVAGSALLMLSRSQKASTASLWVLGLFIALSCVVWLRSIFGLGAMSLWAVVIVLSSWKASPSIKQFFVRVLGVQASIAVFMQFDYLFVDSATIEGQTHHSDTGAIANSLLLPYWFWGSLIATISVLMLAYSLYVAHKPRKA